MSDEIEAAKAAEIEQLCVNLDNPMQLPVTQGAMWGERAQAARVIRLLAAQLKERKAYIEILRSKLREADDA